MGAKLEDHLKGALAKVAEVRALVSVNGDKIQDPEAALELINSAMESLVKARDMIELQQELSTLTR